MISAEAPVAAFSGTSLESELESVGALTSNSSASVMVTVNVSSAVEPSALVALTVIVQLVALS